MRFIEKFAEKFMRRTILRKAKTDWLKRAIYLNELSIKTIQENNIRIANGDYVDLGCGTGNNSIFFSKHFSKIFGLDVSPRNVMYARQTFERANIPAYFIIADAQKLPFKNESFAAASAFALIEHLPDHQTFLKEVYRILTKKGIFIMLCPGSFYSLIDPHTGILFPQFVPKKLKDLFVKKFLPKRKTYNIYDVDQRKAFKIIKFFFKKVYLVKVDYPEIIAWNSIRHIYKFFKKIGVFVLCPLNYLFVCVKK